MRYLILAADYLQATVRNEEPDVEDDPRHRLSLELHEAIADWNERYQAIVPLDMPSRFAVADLIDELDRRGLELAARIEEELRPAKVRYYSEGLLRYVPRP